MAAPALASPNAKPRQLGELPPELLDQIISYTMPEGFGSLARSCKGIHELCKPYMEYHKDLLRRFRRFWYCGRVVSYRAPTFWHPIPNAFNLLERIAAEPMAARYIQHANLRDDSLRPDFIWLPTVPDVNNGGPVLELLARSSHLKRAGIDYLSFYARIAQDYAESSPNPFSQHAAAFLLTLLPNVKSITLPRHWKPNEETDKLLNIIVADARLSRQGSTSLAQVNRLDFVPKDRRLNPVDFINLWPLLALPKLRILRSYGLVAADVPPGGQAYPQTLTGFSKTLQHVYLEGCSIDENAMATFIQAAERLETLVYSHTSPSDGPASQWDICCFLRMVEREAGSRLQRLCVQTSCVLVPARLSMRGFTHIRDLALPLEVFQSHMFDAARRVQKSVNNLTDLDAETLGLRLGDVIPASVADLSLLSPGHGEHAKVLELLFHDFSALRTTLLPVLKRIALECKTDFDNDIRPDPAYQEQCEDLVSKINVASVILEIDTWHLCPHQEWPGSEDF